MTTTPRRPRPIPPIRAAAAAVLVLATACNPVSSRPAFTPYPEDQAVLLTGAVPDLTAQVASWLASQGIHTEWVSPEDGYVESTWYDTDTRQNTDGTGDIGAMQVTFKVRVWLDPDAPGKSRMTAEAVYRPLADPSRTERDQERAARPGSGGAVLVQELIDEMRKKFGGG